MPETDFDRTLWRILAVGMTLRILWALLVPVVPISDSAAYASFARTLVEHGVYGWTADQPTAYWAVGPAAVTAATFLIFGIDNYTGVVILNLIAGAMTIVLVYRLAVIWYDTRTAQIAALLIALWPNLIFFSSTLASELWFIALTLAGLWFHERPDGRPWLNLLMCGVIWGLACYMRPVILLLPVALALVALPDGPRAWLRAGIRATVVVVLIVAVVAPWTMRNARIFGEPVMVSTNFGPNFWMGNNPQSNGGYMPLPDRVGGMSEPERARLLKEEAKAYIQSDPGAFVLRTLQKVVKLHTRETIGIVWNQEFLQDRIGGAGMLVLKLLSTGYWLALLALALVAIGLRFLQSPLHALFHPAIAAWAYFTALHAIIVVEDRYHMPSSPFIALLAASTLAHFLPLQRFSSSRKQMPSI